ncbi:MAG: ASKHA domain-containing protein [Actinomycetota bacterium]|nr:ASKHA domain-containing protein [Actinomycetota bacterium]
MSEFTINFEPLGLRGKCKNNESLLECARRSGVGINSICGGTGACHACRVQVLSGTVSRPSTVEYKVFTSKELKEGWRLACQTYPISDCKITVPADSMTTSQRLQVEGLEKKVSPELPFQVYHVKIAPPSLETPVADADRLIQALNNQHRLRCTSVDIDTLRDIPGQLRSWNWESQVVVRNKEVVTILYQKSRQLGLAIDLGTTKIAAYLIDMNSGQTLAARGIMNPQINYGEDIISRINKVIKSSEAAVVMQRLTLDAINELSADLCAAAGARPEEILETVVVGNTAMHHLFLRLPVKQLAFSPFVPAVSLALEVRARDLGLNIAPGAYVYLMPNIAGFVGADHVSMLLATDAWKAKETTIALDIGTNTEVSLIYGGKITTTSCASGPAFEGGHIKHGMRAAAGAIERLRIDGDKVQYQTINGGPPVGICGSGILDALAQLYQANIIDNSGRIIDSHPRVRVHKGQREFVLVSEEERNGKPAITITQHDVRELQLAKAAIRTGIQILLDISLCSEDDIKQVIIAGAFGSYINIDSAVAIGMMPSLPLNRFQQVGNAAGMGARLALISTRSRAKAQAIASRVKYVELASSPEFNKVFVQANYLGPYQITNK